MMHQVYLSEISLLKTEKKATINLFICNWHQVIKR
jgi:hypothetical protein